MAVIFRSQSVEVVGEGAVAVYWPKSPTMVAGHDVVHAGVSYDLKERKLSK
jgi:hypothetical protein